MDTASAHLEASVGDVATDDDFRKLKFLPFNTTLLLQLVYQ